MTITTDIETALRATLPVAMHTSSPTLARVLAAARDGHEANVASPELIDALCHLQGQTLTISSGISPCRTLVVNVLPSVMVLKRSVPIW
jgi:hypothetical protein